MNSPWTNFKSNFYRFTGVDLFSSVTSETLDFTMDSTVDREHDKSAEDVNDAAVENSEPQLDESAKDVNDAAVENTVEIKYKYPVVKEIPEGLVAQMKENADLVAKFYAAFEGDWIPEALEVWVYFNLYCLRMPEHRNVRFDVFDGSYTYLIPFYPKFRLDAKKKHQDRCGKYIKFINALLFYYESCFGDNNFLHAELDNAKKSTHKRCVEIAFDLFQDKEQREPTGVFLKEGKSWEEVCQQMTGIAFASSPKIVGNLMAIENIERLFTIVDGPNNKVWIITGPVMFARLRCDSASEPLLQQPGLKFHNGGFVSTTDPDKFRTSLWIRAVIDTAAAKSGADSVFVHPCGKAEFVVRHYNVRFPLPECRGCSKCQPGGKSDYINLQGCFACNSLVLSFYLIVYAKAAAAVVRKAAHQSSKKVGRGEGIGEEDLASEDQHAVCSSAAIYPSACLMLVCSYLSICPRLQLSVPLRA
jgi:ribosomal protein S7